MLRDVPSFGSASKEIADKLAVVEVLRNWDLHNGESQCRSHEGDRECQNKEHRSGKKEAWGQSHCVVKA